MRKLILAMVMTSSFSAMANSPSNNWMCSLMKNKMIKKLKNDDVNVNPNYPHLEKYMSLFGSEMSKRNIAKHIDLLRQKLMDFRIASSNRQISKVEVLVGEIKTIKDEINLIIDDATVKSQSSSDFDILKEDLEHLSDYEFDLKQQRINNKVFRFFAENDSILSSAIDFSDYGKAFIDIDILKRRGTERKLNNKFNKKFAYNDDELSKIAPNTYLKSIEISPLGYSYDLKKAELSERRYNIKITGNLEHFYNKNVSDLYDSDSYGIHDHIVKNLTADEIVTEFMLPKECREVDFLDDAELNSFINNVDRDESKENEYESRETNEKSTVNAQ